MRYTIKVEKLLTILRQLRAPEGCLWDQAQTHQSLRPYLLEEACEAIDAITQQDTPAMCEELGDVLLQVAFHAVLAEEANTFNYTDIEQAIVEKLVRRHPHVFGDETIETIADLKTRWQHIKEAEKAKKQEKATKHSAEDTNPADHSGYNGALVEAHAKTASLPALNKAYMMGKLLSWPTFSPTVPATLMQDVPVSNTTTMTPSSRHPAAVEQLGDGLLAWIDYARSHNIDPDVALRDALERRLHHINMLASQAQASSNAIDGPEDASNISGST